MAGNMRLSKDVAGAKALLEQHGYVVIKEASYRRAQERQRIAEALRASAERHEAETRQYAQKHWDEERRLMDRCTFLYGQAMARGATAEELAKDPESVRLVQIRQELGRAVKRGTINEADYPDLLEEIRNS